MEIVKRALLVGLALSFATSGIAYADEDIPSQRLRVLGRITAVDPNESMFSLHTRAGEDLRFTVDEATQFRSPNGSIQGLQDLEVDMAAVVVASEETNGVYLAHVVAVARLDPDRRVVRAMGTIAQIMTADGTFTLEKRDGEVLTIQTNERTRFRSRGGEIQSVEDLVPGMVAFVLAVEQEDGLLLALLVAAGDPEELPDLDRYQGEVIKVVPGQGTFTISTPEGREVTFQTSERTRYLSRGGKIEELKDLEKGMTAWVAASQQEDGLLAMVVAAGFPSDIPGSGVDVRVGGRIVDLGDRSFTIEKRDGGRLTFEVDGSTTYRSRGGMVSSFDDLEVGMVALVGGKRLGNDKIKAVWVGVWKPDRDRPEPVNDTPVQRPPIDLPEPVLP